MAESPRECLYRLISLAIAKSRSGTDLLEPNQRKNECTHRHARHDDAGQKIRVRLPERIMLKRSPMVCGPREDTADDGSENNPVRAPPVEAS